MNDQNQKNSEATLLNQQLKAFSINTLEEFRCHWANRFNPDAAMALHWAQLFKKIGNIKVLQETRDYFFNLSDEWPPTPAKFNSKARAFSKTKKCWRPLVETQEDKLRAQKSFEEAMRLYRTR